MNARLPIRLAWDQFEHCRRNPAGRKRTKTDRLGSWTDQGSRGFWRPWNRRRASEVGSLRGLAQAFKTMRLHLLGKMGKIVPLVVV